MLRLRLDDVHFAYAPEQAALRGVTLVIEPGEQVAVAGANGSGKSTLARCLNGLVRPQRGQVWVGDWEAGAHPVHQMARRVAYVFQNPDEQICQRTVWNEVAFGPKQLGWGAEQVQTQVTQALDQTGLAGAARVHPFDLGRAERKLVTIASALAMDTTVVVMDEPTAGLDGSQLDHLARILDHLRQRRRTVLVITHDLDFAAENLERLVLLADGQVQVDTPMSAAFEVVRDGHFLPQVVQLGQRLGLARIPLTPAALVAEVAQLRDRHSPA